jgi:hypothetical protein
MPSLNRWSPTRSPTTARCDSTLVPPKGGSSPDVELLQPLILLLLVADVGPYRLLVPTDRVDEVPPGPEVLSHKVALPFPVNPGEMDASLRARGVTRTQDCQHRAHLPEGCG